MNLTKYRVNEIFRSVQAEGYHAGRPAVFVRFAGCNLDCKFCDTNFVPYTAMTATEINKRIVELTHGDLSILIVFTGGEPTLQLNDEMLGGDNPKSIETNGLLPIPSWIDWVTISPKSKISPSNLKHANELKFLYGLFDDEYLESFIGHHAHLYIQPLERNGQMNIGACLAFLEKNPAFKLSVQWHKLTGVR